MPFSTRSFALFTLLTVSSTRIALSQTVQPGPGAAEPSTAAEVYGAGVRPTDARTPAEELAGFHLPPGFVAELVAAEPEIAKPLNMAFDSQGRLWVTCTLEYPYPAPNDRTPRDFIRVLEDLDRDGRYEKQTTFVDQLNIPMGLYPTADGVIAFNIPNLYHFRDRDGDLRCDDRQLLLGPFDTTRDTHGMINAIQRGDDGWMYACHGFNNQSRVTGRDGHPVEMISGNTFRFKPDGSRIEHFTHGQVNPFGMTSDAWGNRFTADCHSKPITQLLPGGYYSSFGRPDDGLGFVPSMMEHLHGSTAICGLVVVEGDSFPAAYQRQFLSGNVMTSRINRNLIVPHGATLHARELADFLTSDDPWFRPVDLQWGPDGALYIADFYNKIIGHYEVPLDHPERDRERGRIWRIVYRGDSANAPRSTSSPLPNANSDPASLRPHLASTNPALRRLSLERLVDGGDEAARNALHESLSASAALERVSGMWGLHQLKALDEPSWLKLAADPEALVRAHAARCGGERSDWAEKTRTTMVRLLDDPDSQVVRDASVALARQASATEIPALLRRLRAVDENDPLLRQAIRIAIRDAIDRPEVANTVDGDAIMLGEDGDAFASILLGAKHPAAGRWLLTRLQRSSRSLDTHLVDIQRASEILEPKDIPSLIELLRAKNPPWNIQRLALLKMRQARGNRFESAEAAVNQWADALGKEWLETVRQRVESAQGAIVSWTSDGGQPWRDEPRQAEDGMNEARYRSSLTLGERYTGVMSTGSFPAPERLEFWIVGHNGFPDKPDSGLNRVRLVLDTRGETLLEALPPRSDTARRVAWDLSKWKGESVHLECVDRDDGTAYAWLAVGRFDYPPLQTDDLSSLYREGLDLFTEFHLTERVPELLRWSSDARLGTIGQLMFLKAASELQGDAGASQLAQALLGFRGDGESIQQLILAAKSSSVDAIAPPILKKIASQLLFNDQVRLAKTLASQRQSLAWLLSSVQSGDISAEVLRQKDVMQSLEALGTETQKAEAQAIVAALPSADAETEQFATKLLASLNHPPGDRAQGGQIFQKHCAVCHQLGGQGSLVGPQLDGAVVRGAARLLEDILFPDRNVDRAFRTTTLLLDSGTVKAGLIRNETEAVIELVESNGQVVRIDPATVETRQPSVRSLMPGGMHRTIGEQGLRDLLQYLTAAQGPASREIKIKTKDLSAETQRQTIVDRESGQYLGHPTTVLLEDGKTILCVYPKGHGRGAIILKRSEDGGKTWSDRLPVPENWSTSLETPTIHRVIDASGRKRLIVWSGLYPARLAVSEDDGRTWTPLKPVGDWGGIVVMGALEPLSAPGHYVAFFHDDGRFIAAKNQAKKPVEFTLYQTRSNDGGLTWSAPQEILRRSDIHLCEPGIVRSPDGKEWAMLLRENSRQRNAHVIFSRDEGATWSSPRELPAALTGDRHVGKYLSDGRLFISFRDMAHESPWRGDWVAWIGQYTDLSGGGEGELRVRLMDNKKGTDCAYPAVEILPDGKIVTITYGHWTERRDPYIVSIRCKPSDLH